MRSSLLSKGNIHTPRRLIPSKWRSRSKRKYHSEHHPEPPPFPDVQQRMLSAALRHVPTHGFSAKALSEGARDSGYLEVSVQLFPRGVFDLINFYLVTQRLALKDRVHFLEEAKLGLGQKVRALTLNRLRANEDIIHQWRGVREDHDFSHSCRFSNQVYCRHSDTCRC